jgi:hypothetical protein
LALTVPQHRRLSVGAQVRRMGGRSETPDSSRKQIQADDLGLVALCRRRAGRCGLQLSRRRMRHTRPGW